MKRALRVDKIRLAALEATLRLYRDPDRLARAAADDAAAGAAARRKSRRGRARLLPSGASAVGPASRSRSWSAQSQIGSGALPLETMPSAGLAIRPSATRGGRASAEALAAALRGLPMPVIGRIEDRRWSSTCAASRTRRLSSANLAALDLSEGSR